MQASVFKLLFNDPDLKMACSLEIGTYTTDTVKIVGSYLLYLAHPDPKKLQEVTFYVAQNCARAQSISQHVDAGELNIPHQQGPIILSLTRVMPN